jgi:hypothetical protein
MLSRRNRRAQRLCDSQRALSMCGQGLCRMWLQGAAVLSKGPWCLHRCASWICQTMLLGMSAVALVQFNVWYVAAV